MEGRWADKPGEIVLNRNPTDSTGRDAPTLTMTIAVPGGQTLTVVGFAYSVSGSADAWVTPAQMTSLKPTSTQVLYRFAHAATNAQVSAGQSAVTTGLPSGALVGAQSYLQLRALATGEPNRFVPFLMVFGWLGLAVAVLIVANVVTGAVVAGFKHIGVLKALGFTPTQVMTVYLAMVSIPALTTYQTAASRVGAVDLTMFGRTAEGGAPPPGEEAPPAAKFWESLPTVSSSLPWPTALK